MKFKRPSYYYGSDALFSVAEAVRTAIEDDANRYDSGGAVEQAHTIAVNAADVLGQFIEILADKGLLTEAEILTVIGAGFRPESE